jgi:hyperosmotically inducible periplasmic protein
MTKLFTQTMIAAGIALSAVGLVHAADHNKDQKGEQHREQHKDQSHNRTMGQVVDDSTITAKVKAKHAEDKMVSAMRINVDTREGVVLLTGEARTEGEMKRAETLAKQVDGVKSVTNKIELRTRSQQQ